MTEVYVCPRGTGITEQDIRDFFVNCGVSPAGGGPPEPGNARFALLYGHLMAAPLVDHDLRLVWRRKMTPEAFKAAHHRDPPSQERRCRSYARIVRRYRPSPLSPEVQGNMDAALHLLSGPEEEEDVHE